MIKSAGAAAGVESRGKKAVADLRRADKLLAPESILFYYQAAGKPPPIMREGESNVAA